MRPGPRLQRSQKQRGRHKPLLIGKADRSLQRIARSNSRSDQVISLPYEKFSRAMQRLFSVLLVSSFALATAVAQTAPLNGLSGSGSAFPGALPAMQPGRSAGRVGIPLGSTGLSMPGESPLILDLGATPVTGKSAPLGASGIPLGSTELSRNAGLSPSPRLVTPNGCTAIAWTGGSGGRLPQRLFDGNAGQSWSPGIGAANACANTGLAVARQGAVTQGAAQGRAGLGLGATELTNGGLSGIVSNPSP
jgi:hypothetical protein